MIFGGVSPRWFLGYDAILEVIFLLITLLISWYAFKIYRLSGERRFIWWSIGFLSVSGAYAVNAFANYYLFAHLTQIVGNPVPAAMDIDWIHLLGHLTLTGFFIGGYLLLAMVMLRFDDTRLITIYASLVALLSIAIVLANHPLILNLTNVVILGHILYFVWFNPESRYKKDEKPMRPRLRKFVVSGFGLLFLGQLSYLFVKSAGIMYVVGHGLELLGFGLLATSMILILKK